MYYRRRIVALVLTLVLLGGLTAGGFAAASMITSALAARNDQPINTGTDPTSSSTESASGTDDPTAAGKPKTGCEETTVTVTAATDRQVYPAEANPLLTLQVKNGGKTDCALNLGTSQMEFLITSGNDRIFSSKDCQVDPEDKYHTLTPGQSELANFQWTRIRTAPGCDPVHVKPKPGVYKLVAKLGERESDAAVFELE